MKAENILKEAVAIQDVIKQERRYLHKNAEVGFELKNTVAFVKNELENMGITYCDCGKAGVTAIVGGKVSGGVFLLRADMDALPIKEEVKTDFSAENGRMHGCGHDMHTAMLLGAARILKKHEKEITGTVKLMFQPAEEILAGANDMIESGLLENPHVDAGMMIHTMTAVPLETGSVIVSSPGESAPAADYFKVTVRGRGTHGSMPNMGIDPITASSHIIIALQEIHSRELAMNDRAVLTVGSIGAGEAANVIPDKAEMMGCVRAFDEELRNRLKDRITEISERIASAFGAEAEVVFTNGCPALVNDKVLSGSVKKYMCELLGKERVLSADELSGNSDKVAGSEDFAYVSRKIPSVMLAVAAGNSNDGYEYPQHHPRVSFDEDVLAVGSAVYAYTALRWLSDVNDGR